MQLYYMERNFGTEVTCESANCRYVAMTELSFLACLQRICPALLFQVSQGLLAHTPHRPPLFSAFPSQLSRQLYLLDSHLPFPAPQTQRSFPASIIWLQSLNPIKGSLSEVTQSCLFPRPGPYLLCSPVLVIHSVCQSPCLYFLWIWGLLTLIICHFVSLGPVPTLFQTFQSESTTLCNSPHHFQKEKKGSKPKSFNNGCCYYTKCPQSSNNVEEIPMDSLAIFHLLLPNLVMYGRQFSPLLSRSLRVSLSFIQLFFSLKKVRGLYSAS